MNVLNNALGIHEQALQMRSLRLETLAQNIANADTPHYKARDVDFRAVMDRTQQLDTQMSATRSVHYEIGQDVRPDGLRFRTPFNTSFDGNTVEMSVEQSHYGKAAADYQATLQFLENRVSGIRKALRGE